MGLLKTSTKSLKNLNSENSDVPFLKDLPKLNPLNVKGGDGRMKR